MERRAGERISIAVAMLVGCAALTCGLQRAEAQEAPATFELSPALPAEGDAIVAGVDLVSGPIFASTVQVEGNFVILNVSEPALSPRPPGTPQHLDFNLPTLVAGNYTVLLSFSGGLARFPFAVRPRAAHLNLIGGRFQVAVTGEQQGARPTAVKLSQTGGYFWFFDPEDIEITIKVVDGRALNGHYWVFIASMTDTPLTVTLTDTSAGCPLPNGNPCPSRSYTNPPHTNQNFIDVNAF
jgi:hypothetical protein